MNERSRKILLQKQQRDSNSLSQRQTTMTKKEGKQEDNKSVNRNKKTEKILYNKFHSEWESVL